MLHAARKQFLGIALEPLAVFVLGADAYLGRALHLLANIREAEATFFFIELAVSEDDLRVDEDELLRRVLCPCSGQSP